MARRVWVVPSSWPSDPHGEKNGGAVPEDGGSLHHGDPKSLLVRLRAKRKPRVSRAGAAETAPTSTSPEPGE